MIITSAQILGYHPYYTGLVNQQYDQISQEPVSNEVILFKSLIANMARFLLWLSITSIMIEVFKVALAQWLLFYQWI